MGLIDPTEGPVPSEQNAPPSLEVRYRRLLRLLPAGYRHAREQQMADAFLQRSIDEDPELADFTLRHGWPELSEVARVLRLALWLRFGNLRAPERLRVPVLALRVMTLGCLTVLAVVAAQNLVGRVLVAIDPPTATVSAKSGLFVFGTDVAAWSLLREWSFVLWIPALSLAVFGRRRAIIAGAALAAVPAAVTFGSMIISSGVAALVAGGWVFVAVQWGVVAGLVGMAAAGGDVTVPVRRRWVAASVAGLVAWEVLMVVAWLADAQTMLSSVGYLVVDTVGFWSGVVVFVTIALLVRRVRGGPVAAATLLGLSGLAGVATVLAVTTLPYLLPYVDHGGPGSTQMLISTLVQLGVSALIAVWAATGAVIRIRRMPSATYEAEPPVTA